MARPNGDTQPLPIQSDFLTGDTREMFRRQIEQFLRGLQAGAQQATAGAQQAGAPPLPMPEGEPMETRRPQARTASVFGPARSGQTPGFVGFHDPESRRRVSRRRMSDNGESPFDILLTKLDQDEAMLMTSGLQPQQMIQGLMNLRKLRYDYEVQRSQFKFANESQKQERLQKAHANAMTYMTKLEMPPAQAFRSAARGLTGEDKAEFLAEGAAVGTQMLPIQKEERENRQIQRFGSIAQLMEALEAGPRQERLAGAAITSQETQAEAERKARAKEGKKGRKLQRDLASDEMGIRKQSLEEERTHRQWQRDVETFKTDAAVKAKGELPYDRQLELTTGLATRANENIRGIAAAETDDRIGQTNQMINRARSFVKTLRDSKFDETVIRDTIDQGVDNPSIRNFLMFEEALRAGQGAKALAQMSDTELTHPAARIIVERTAKDPKQRAAILRHIDGRRQRQLKRTGLGNVIDALVRAIPGGRPLFRDESDLEKEIDDRAADAILEGTIGRDVLRRPAEPLPLPTQAAPPRGIPRTAVPGRIF